MAQPSEYEQARNLPISEKVGHRIWRVRQDAYIAMEKAFREALDQNDRVFSSYGLFCGFC